MNQPTPSMLDTPDTTIITGAAGWFGTGLVAELTSGDDWRRGGSIRAFVQSDEDAHRLHAMTADSDTQLAAIVGDIRKSADVAKLFDGLSGTVDVIHAAGIIHPPKVADFVAINEGGTKNVSAAARDHGIRRMVHVSSNSPFGTNAHPGDMFGQHEPYRPYFGYGESKMDAELAVLAEVDRGLNAVIVRPPWFYGPHQPPRQTEFFKMVKAGRFPVFGKGDQNRSMTYIDNLVQGVVRAELVETEPGQGWWVADAKPYTVREIVDTVGQALSNAGYDVKPNKLKAPNFVANAAERADGLIQKTGRYQQQVHVLGEMNKNIACDISATTRDLGYEPQVALAEGMRRSIEWCQQAGYEI